MRKFPKLRYPNHPDTDGLKAGEVVVTEKIDGANFRFTYDECGELIVGTRNHTYHHEDENLPKAFRHAVDYILDTVPYKQEFQRYTVFGEANHLHSLEYEGVEYKTPESGPPHFGGDAPNVVVFDAYDNREDRWLHWDGAVQVFHMMELRPSQVLERGDPNDLSFDIPEESMFGGPPEGIVARRVDGTVRAKKVTDDFKETNAVTFNDASKAQTDAGEFVATYITDARVEKAAHKLVDEGQYDRLCMDMMQDLPRNVLEDAMAENGWDLLTSGSIEVEWDDEFKSEVRSKASKKCARVLKTEVQSL